MQRTWSSLTLGTTPLNGTVVSRTLTLDDLLSELRSRNEPVPRPFRRPTLADVEFAESQLGVKLHADYRRFLLVAGDVTYGTKEPLTVVAEGSHVDLVRVVRCCWKRGVPARLLPFCEDNGNYFCLTEAGEVVYWDHNGMTSERWPDLAAWIHDVWLEGAG